MNRFTHAHLARQLVDACGGGRDAAKVCRVQDTQLGQYADPHGTLFMPADVIADLERFCGQPIYSRALFEAQPWVAENKALTDEAFEATEAAGVLQAAVRRAAAKGPLSPDVRRGLLSLAELLRDEADDVTRHLQAGDG